MSRTENPAAAESPEPPEPNATSRLVRQHLRFGWWALLVFLSLGVILELFHGLKVQWYLASGNHTRKLLWTLAHAHGTLLAVVNIVYALSLPRLPRLSATTRILASRSLIGSAILLPGGFFLGGIYIYAGDPGLGVLLTPVGALLLLIGVFLAARGVE